MPQSGTRSVLPTLVRNGSDRSGVVPCSLRRPKALENAVRLLYHKSKQTTFAGARPCPRPAAAGPFDGTMFSVPESVAFR